MAMFGIAKQTRVNLFDNSSSFFGSYESNELWRCRTQVHRSWPGNLKTWFSWTSAEGTSIRSMVIDLETVSSEQFSVNSFQPNKANIWERRERNMQIKSFNFFGNPCRLCNANRASCLSDADLLKRWTSNILNYKHGSTKWKLFSIWNASRSTGL